VQWPGKVKPASTSDLVSATIDMMPTLCDLLKIPVPENVNGLSILPTILGKNNRQRQHEYLYFEYPQYGGQQAVRMGKWKAVRLNILKGTLKTALFDLSADMQEQHDIASQHPDIVKQMEEIMKKEHHTPDVASFRMEAIEEDAK
jgi:arylsulfatase